MLGVQEQPMRHRASCVLLLAWFSVACAGVQARSDFDPNARFDTYRSFALLGEQGTLSGETSTQGVDPLLARRIRESIASNLEARGYEKLDDPAAADFVISFSLGKQEKIQIQSSPVLAGRYYGYGGWYGSNVSATSYTEGTLSIDVFDGRSHLAVWHGWASKRVSDTTDRAALVDEVVNAILAKFPPSR
jgi:hypothetical protein